MKKRKKRNQSTNDFFVFFHNLFHHLLDDCLPLVLHTGACILGHLGVVHVVGEFVGFLVLGQEFFLPADPGGPLVENTLACLDHSGVGDVDGVLVLLFEFLGVLPEIPAHLLLFFFAKEGCGAGAPDELLELVGWVFGEGVTGKTVDDVAVFHLRCEVSKCVT